eukprot:8448-Heterococcus_DN1.PRE.1
MSIIGGHLGTLQWLCRKGYALVITEVEHEQNDVYSSSLAVRFGHHSMVQYLLENGVGLKPDVRRQAVLGGSLQMLRFLYGHTAVMAYLLEQGAQWPEQLRSLAGSGEAASHSA